ncbi:hypothetical protein [Denitrobaculum tricleocarpae]|uniref:Lipoprotein n=1 Tax=Denitrobaculum tricleocarpae TaxID=2591009 RepID=A0A545TWP7_9PROT|nr:hypothetical protein [Denitrobaculum tricleocarpae]TQV81639.1 hypothetical protein FKG95_05150 [Denitrobaculum tricleocarpae]
MIRPWAVMGPVFLLISGCAQFDRQGPDPEEVQASIESDSTVPIDLTEPDAMEQALVTQGQPPLPRRKPETQPAPTPAPETVEEADPDMLIGLDFTVTRALLGEPAQQTEQSPAKIWTYKGQECMLNVFFYPSVEGGAFRLLTYEAEGGETPPEEVAADTDAAASPAVPTTGEGQGAEEQSAEEVSAFTATCFTALLREAEQERESERLKQAQRSSESGQSLNKEPPLAE